MLRVKAALQGFLPPSFPTCGCAHCCRSLLCIPSRILSCSAGLRSGVLPARAQLVQWRRRAAQAEQGECAKQTWCVAPGGRSTTPVIGRLRRPLNSCDCDAVWCHACQQGQAQLALANGRPAFINPEGTSPVMPFSAAQVHPGGAAAAAAGGGPATGECSSQSPHSCGARLYPRARCCRAWLRNEASPPAPLHPPSHSLKLACGSASCNSAHCTMSRNAMHALLPPFPAVESSLCAVMCAGQEGQSSRRTVQLPNGTYAIGSFSGGNCGRPARPPCRLWLTRVLACPSPRVVL